MCEYSGRLIAWLDGELPDQEATNVEWHVRQCAECRNAASTYEEVGDAFFAAFEAGIGVQARHTSWRWPAVSGAVAVAASIVALIFLTQPAAEKLSFHPPSPPPAPIAAVHARAHRPHRATQTPLHRQWIASEPSIQVALPADALFPPGAVPQGFSFIADVHFQQ